MKRIERLEKETVGKQSTLEQVKQLVITNWRLINLIFAKSSSVGKK